MSLRGDILPLESKTCAQQSQHFQERKQNFSERMPRGNSEWSHYHFTPGFPDLCSEIFWKIPPPNPTGVPSQAGPETECSEGTALVSAASAASG